MSEITRSEFNALKMDVFILQVTLKMLPHPVSAKIRSERAKMYRDQGYCMHDAKIKAESELLQEYANEKLKNETL